MVQIFNLQGQLSINCKVFRLDKPSTQPSTSMSAAVAFPKIRYSSLHKAEEFADDLTVISNDAKSHQRVL